MNSKKVCTYFSGCFPLCCGAGRRRAFLAGVGSGSTCWWLFFLFFYFIFLITYECLIFTFLRRTNLTSKLNLIFVQFVVYCIVPVVQYVHIVGAGAAKLGDTGAGALQNCVFYRAPGHWDQSRHTLFSTEPLDTGTGAATLYFLQSPWTRGPEPPHSIF